ncbi:hypothetical protein MMC34_008276 [Xylographa carneopallida]|nr:hypothetical protein [Xylographa carneopallida]
MNKKPEIISPKVVESTQSPAEQSVSKSPKVVKSTKSPAEQSISEFLNSLDFPLDPALLLETTLDGEYSTDTISLNSVSAGIGDVDQSHNDGLDSFITQIDNIDLDSIEDINDGAEHDNKRQDYNISGVENLNNFINMDSIDEALADLELQDVVNDSETAKKYKIDRTTLSRRHRGVTAKKGHNPPNSALLSIEQRNTLIAFINHLTERSLHPTPRLVAAKIAKFGILPENTYNMDDKGFLIGVLQRLDGSTS